MIEFKKLFSSMFWGKSESMKYVGTTINRTFYEMKFKNVFYDERSFAGKYHSSDILKVYLSHPAITKQNLVLTNFNNKSVIVRIL